LTKTFGGVTAVSNMAFDLPEGKLLGVIGPNGSGKTTLVNLITGFVKPWRAASFKGKDITGWPPTKW
jgi:branched-chain amino acid transport system ATP-binding protein